MDRNFLALDEINVTKIKLSSLLAHGLPDGSLAAYKRCGGMQGREGNGGPSLFLAWG